MTAHIGAGGMGEVYKARDTRLDRSVAIKILGPLFAADSDGRARFEREARTVAAFDHPHICSIFDVGVADGTFFLVMPLLEGQTLTAHLEKGPLPVDQALTLAAEIADALDKAHRQGIVHRDLKPANIMLTKSGSKLLDFGLAKLRAPNGPISTSGMARVQTTLETVQGTILGTVQYMAPEQVEGKDADPRSDIWALGAVIYEMTTGTRPFAGDTPASVIGAILKDTPASISTRQPLAPPALNDVVERCLAKDPDERWQSIADVGRILQDIASNQKADSAKRAPPRGGSKERLAWIAVTVLMSIALAYVSVWRRPVVQTGDLVRLSVNPPNRLMFAAHINATVPTPQFAVSPDGRSIAFVAASPAHRPTIWLRSLDDVDARVLPGTEDASEPFWSPDSRWLAFFDGQGRLRKVAGPGGPVQTITDSAFDPRGGSWAADDTILFGTGYGGLQRVPAKGGTPQAVTDLDASGQEGSHRWPHFLPDGRHFFYTVRSGLSEQRGVYVGSLDDKAKVFLLRSDGNMQYVAPGYVLFLNEDTLLGQSFDLARLALEGQPIPIAARVGRSSRGDGAFSSSSKGTLAYAGSNTLQPGRLTWFDRSGRSLGEVGPDGDHDYADFRLSPDETRLAASLLDPKVALPDIWLIDLVRGNTSRFTFGPALNSAAVWSPDNGRIAFRTNRKGLVELYQRSAAGGGDDQPLLVEDAVRAMGVGSSNLLPSDWSSDGQYIAVATGIPTDLWLLPAAGKKNPVRLTRSPSAELHANFSPDGRFVAYTSNESGRYEVYAQTLPQSDRKWTISTDGGYEPRWRADGREIYYLSEDRKLMAVLVSTGAAPFGVPKALFQTEVHAGVYMLRTHYVPNRAGTRFLVHTRSGDLVPVPITVVLNWTNGSKK